ncbi:MAG: glutathione synthase [Proteobacteria bacterium]|nr:glutathione synthase [Pseudomonadota bacterium]
MAILIVVNNPHEWHLQIPGVSVVAARAYLTDPAYAEGRSVKVFNLCRSYRYQSLGYYVSLLAEARGHKPLPRTTTIEDLKSRHLARFLTEELDERIQRDLGPIKSDTFDLSIYFGRNTAHRYDALCQQLFRLMPAPMLRVTFERVPPARWRIRALRPIAASDVPPQHAEFVVEAATEYFQGRYRHARKKSEPRFSLAILTNPDNPEPPSDGKALRQFEAAAEAVGFEVEFITSEDRGRLAEFDALFIRDTTAVNHYTYRFARRAAAEGLVVIDDPESILKCSNKVYLAELLGRHGVPIPRSLLVHRDNVGQIIPTLSLPVVLKQPDSAFSLGVVKVENEQELMQKCQELLGRSELIVAQEWLPTEFDWRVGILDRRPLYVCKYFMAPGHWQIISREGGKAPKEGPWQALSVGEAPEEVVKTAVKAAGLIGDGLYGVDLKQVGSRVVVIEVNDNPSVESGVEDGVMKEALYREIVGTLLRRVEQRKRGSQP